MKELRVNCNAHKYMHCCVCVVLCIDRRPYFNISIKLHQLLCILFIVYDGIHSI